MGSGVQHLTACVGQCIFSLPCVRVQRAHLQNVNKMKTNNKAQITGEGMDVTLLNRTKCKLEEMVSFFNMSWRESV